ncbi:hypothetical protein GH714_030884 [Hevea brasiliensis]|uniref:Uncharacterized protein n=1 Tax=Hevea brasiliensis TaxID=3981 RepID=A0A6A6LPB3_HEVBR|nr:hypothetical protein GH714_030884 [Hevea brasiliensis]
MLIGSEGENWGCALDPVGVVTRGVYKSRFSMGVFCGEIGIGGISDGVWSIMGLVIGGVKGKGENGGAENGGGFSTRNWGGGFASAMTTLK